MIKIVRLLAGLLLAILIFLIVAGGILIYLNFPPNGATTSKSEKDFKVEYGESIYSIGERLKSQKLIKSSLFFRLLTKLEGVDKKIKAGYYKIKKQSTVVDIINTLISGKQEEVKITFPEGWTIKKIAKHLENKGITSASDFIKATYSKKILKKFNIPGKSLEGFLFPDTYYFPKGYPAHLIAEAMVENFFEKLEKIEPGYKKLSAKKLYDKIILASIVEREYRLKEEAPLIASVFYNRLSRNIGLESCATLEYIITEIENRPHPKYITLKDKEIDSPYNTYKWAGLPPGPISNPGVVAIDAVFHPAKTDYWYFVLEDKKTGKHYFSKSLEEHNKAKYKYIYLKRVSSGS